MLERDYMFPLSLAKIKTIDRAAVVSMSDAKSS